MIGINDSSGAIAHTQGGMQHLIQHLWDEYLVSLESAIEERKKAGRAMVTIEKAKKLAPAADFIVFASKYLAEHRPVETFYVDANMGIRLSNQTCVALSPGADIRGTMQDANAIGVTEGRSQANLNGVIADENKIIRI